MTDLPRISHSQIQAWLRCEKMWEYKYRRAWVPKKVPTYFGMGNFIHGKLDIMYQTWDPEDSIGDRWDFMQARILEDIDPLGSNSEFVARCMKAMYRYIHEFSPQIDEGIEVIGSEYNFAVELITPKGRHFLLEGFVDLLYKKKGQVIVRDHKSTGAGKFWHKDDLFYDTQQTTYIAALRQLGFDVFRGEINEINTYDYKDWAGVPLEKLFQCPYSHRTQEDLNAILLWFGKTVDRMLDEQDFQRAMSKECRRCPYRHPCQLQLKGRDDSTILSLEFKKKDEGRERLAAP